MSPTEIGPDVILETSDWRSAAIEAIQGLDSLTKQKVKEDDLLDFYESNLLVMQEGLIFNKETSKRSWLLESKFEEKDEVERARILIDATAYRLSSGFSTLSAPSYSSLSTDKVVYLDVTDSLPSIFLFKTIIEYSKVVLVCSKDVHKLSYSMNRLKGG